MVVLTKRFRTILLTNSPEYLEEDLNLEEEDLSYIWIKGDFVKIIVKQTL